MRSLSTAERSEAGRPRLILADDHPLIVEALTHLLRGEFEIAVSVADGAELVKAVGQIEADVVVTDLSMPGLNGVRAIARVRESRPGLGIVALSMHAEASYAREALAAGAQAYVVKTEASEELVTAIRAVLRGERYVSSSLRSRVDPPDGRADESRGTADPDLNHRQREVLRLLAQGLTAREIGEKLNISAKTVAYHRSRLLALLQLRTTAELIRYGTRVGLV